MKRRFETGKSWAQVQVQSASSLLLTRGLGETFLRSKYITSSSIDVEGPWIPPCIPTDSIRLEEGKRNRKRFGREPNPESRKIRHVKRAATFSYRADYLSSFNSIKNRRVKRAEPGIPPVVKSAPSTTLSPPPFLPAIPGGTAFRILYDVSTRSWTRVGDGDGLDDYSPFIKY